MKLSVQIATPEKLVFEDGEIDSVTVPTSLGEITILPNHIPLISKVVPGEVIVRKKGSEQMIATLDGFLRLNNLGKVNILSDYAVRSEGIEEAKAQEARKKAEDIMKERTSSKDFAMAEAQLKRALFEMKIAEKRKVKHQPKVS